MRIVVAALAVALACAAPIAAARGGGHAAGHSSHSSASHHGSGSHGKAAPGVERDSHGKIARSEKPKHEFRKSHPCPSTGKTRGACPGYVIDHITPLKRGGADAPSNMQWQSAAEAKAKDKWE